MLHEFVTQNRNEIILRCRARISGRPAPRATDAELEHGVPLFLDQLVDALRFAQSPVSSSLTIDESAALHGKELMSRGFTIAQVVRDYGGICQTITELAIETGAPVSTTEFQTLNLCLDNAIAGAVTEYGRLREHEGTERLGRLAHELRNLLNSAVLSFEMLTSGEVGVGGSTGGVLGRSLSGLRNLIDRELAEVRLGAGILYREPVIIREFIEDVEVAATMEANARGVQLTVASIPENVIVVADRQILESVVANLLQNAFKFTPPKGHILLRATASADRVLIDVTDQCGGLPPGNANELLLPFEQRSANRTGLGLGLAISRRGAQANGGEISVVDNPGIGCVFTVDLPRQVG